MAARPPLRDKFATARKELASSPIEREEEIDLVLTVLPGHEHVLLVGPPTPKESTRFASQYSMATG